MELKFIVGALGGLPLGVRIKDRSFATDSIFLKLRNLLVTFLSVFVDTI